MNDEESVELSFSFSPDFKLIHVLLFPKLNKNKIKTSNLHDALNINL